MKELTIVVDDEMEVLIRQSIDERKSFRLDGGEVKNSFGEIVKFRSITFQIEDDNPNDFSLQSPEEYYGGRFPPG